MEAPFFSYVNHFMYIYLCELHYVYNIMCINQENERRTAALILYILFLLIRFPVVLRFFENVSLKLTPYM